VRAAAMRKGEQPLVFEKRILRRYPHCSRDCVVAGLNSSLAPPRAHLYSEREIIRGRTMQDLRQPVLLRRAFLQMSAATAALGLTACVDDLANNGWDSTTATGEDRKLLAFFSQSFTRELEEAPEFMTQLGMKKR
jgi:hypothetical protein